MPRDIKENILLDYLNIGIFSERINILLIGGGKAALIKVKNLIKTKAKITVLAKEFIEELEKIENINKIKDSYKEKYLKGYHLVIICIDNNYVLENIKEDCLKKDKLFLNCTNGKDGDFVIQSTLNTKNINVGLNIKNKNPKGSLYLKEKIRDSLEELDKFIEYTTNIRNNIKDKKEKDLILSFIHSDDFKFIFDKGKGDYVLKMFFENID